MATIKDVARVAKVSVATVSRVINQDPKVKDSTREQVLAVVRALGYQLNANARALKAQKTSTIGVAIPDIGDPFFAALTKGVDTIARENQCQLLISSAQNSAESERQAIALLLARRCDAIIVYATHLDDAELIDLSEQHPQMVIIGREVNAIANKCVWLDNQIGGQLVAEYLMSQGHSATAAIMSNFEIADPSLRLTGFRSTLAKRALAVSDPAVVYQSPDQQGGELAAKALLQQPLQFSAVFAYNDAMAIGAICAFEEAGFKVPDDISVVGFDDIVLAHYSRPKLTTVCYPIEQMAKVATQLALTGEQTAQQGRFEPQLIQRNSVANLTQTDF